MRRYQKWLSVGLLALTPGVTLAGPFSGLKKDKAAGPATTASSTRADAAAQKNQEAANRIAQSLRKTHLPGEDIEIVVDKGVATLSGVVATPDQKATATKAASAAVKGIKVNNLLVVAESTGRGPIQQAVASRPKGARPQRARQVQYEGEEPLQVEGNGAVPPGIAPAAAPIYNQNPGPIGGPMAGAPGGGLPSGMGGMAAPMPGSPYPGGSNMLYNQPNNPNYAWPSYAQYPNYSAVTYPTQYSASAWPYIGPFYPYPQVPIGWRKATLEWDDGYWNLSFSPRTDRWWWFLDWRNW